MSRGDAVWSFVTTSVDILTFAAQAGLSTQFFMGVSFFELQEIFGSRCAWDSHNGETGAIGGIVNSVIASIPAKVLLVDDEDQQLELRAYVLRLAGYSVFTATDPLQALSLARRIEGLDFAILDYDMPTMNGGILARHLKANFPKLVVILYSAAVGIPSRALDMVDAFIPKGENVTALLQYLAIMSADAMGHRYHPEAAAPYDNSESPPQLGCAELSLLPAILAATNEV